MFGEWAAPFLISISQFLGVATLPREPSTVWNLTLPWAKTGDHAVFAAESTTLSKLCSQNPSHTVRFPTVIQSAQYVFVNGRSVAAFNDATFRTVSSFYGTLTVPCALLTEPGKVEWKVVSYSHYFARLSSWPVVEPTAGFHNFFAETLHSLVAGALFILGLFSLIVFWRKVASRAVLSLSLGTFFLAFYFGGMTPALFHIPGRMILVHKVADICLWIGMAGVFAFLRTQKLFNQILLKCFFVTVVLAVAIIALAPNGDTAQLGTTLPFVYAPAVLSSAFFRTSVALRQKAERKRNLIAFVEVLIFILTAANDIGFVMGLFPTVPLLPLGMLAILFFAALSLENQVKQIYKERDYLRENLEKEVAAKTSSLEQALRGLKCAQAELVQSAKLASLGTLSAGIAHEINNSLNYVNGSLSPLSSILRKEEISEGDRKKAARLIEVMKDGLHLTSQIIANLKSYTRTGSGEKEPVGVRELVEGVLVILRNKVKKGVEVDNQVSPELYVMAEKVGLSQVLMNLIDNAIDAMDSREGGERRLHFEGGEDAHGAWFSVRDSGPGIPEHIKAQIYDPFFTTKPEGKGTGLGLYIVNNEIKKQGGAIELVSRPGEGTTFTIRLEALRRKVAA